jgi:hypothetical protein
LKESIAGPENGLMSNADIENELVTTPTIKGAAPKESANLGISVFVMDCPNIDMKLIKQILMNADVMNPDFLAIFFLS